MNARLQGLGSMTETKDSGEQIKSDKRCWYVWDIVLIGSILLYGALFDHLGVIGYVGGRLGTYLLNGQMLGLMYLFIPALICLLVLVRRMRVTWRWRIPNRRMRRLLGLSVMVGLAIYFALPFAGIIPLPRGYAAFAHGFKKRLETKTDVAAIRAWLVELDPSDCEGDEITLDRDGEYGNPIWPDTIPWSESITCFVPICVCLSVDRKNRPMIELTWGGGMARWGLVVGDENMDMPALKAGIEREYRVEFCKGAYVWAR